MRITARDLALILLAAFAITVRATAEYFGPNGVDYTWVTSFAMLIIGPAFTVSQLDHMHRANVPRLENLKETVNAVQQQTEGQTNDQLAEKLDEIKSVIDDTGTQKAIK